MRNELQEAVEYLENQLELVRRYAEDYPDKDNYTALADIYTTALDTTLSALLDALQRQPDPDTGLVPCGGKMRIDIPPGNDSVRASTGLQRDGGNKTERRCNQCVHCGQEMPEGDQVCGHCRRQHGY